MKIYILLRDMTLNRAISVVTLFSLCKMFYGENIVEYRFCNTLSKTSDEIKADQSTRGTDWILA